MSSENYMSGQANEKIVEGLKKILGNTFILYFKTHSFHWNVEGPHFKDYHEMLGEQYNTLWKVTDELAERIRALGSYAPTSYKELLSGVDLSEQTLVPKAAGMMAELAKDHEKCVETIFPVLRLAEDAGDEVTVDMLIERITDHEKTAWMLRSLGK